MIYLFISLALIQDCKDSEKSHAAKINPSILLYGGLSFKLTC